MKTKVMAACIVSCLFLAGAFGQTIDISGKVVDETAVPVTGASVALTKGGISGLSSAAGAYHLSSTPVRAFQSSQGESAPVFMRGSDLCMQCGSQTRVGVQLFGLDGRVLASKPAVLLGPGTHVVAGGLFFREIRSFACGILVVTAGDHRYNLRVTLVGGGILAGASGSAAGLTPRLSKTAADTIADTLRIVKAGYDTVKVCLGRLVDTMPDVYLTTPAGYPRMIINNATTILTLYKPDAKNGYSRGTRFDWSGIIGKAQNKGHTWYGDYTLGSHDPLSEGTGTAGEFGIDSATGYSGTQPFLKIGVGKLQGTGGSYDFRANYQILDPGVWNIVRGKYWVQFTHVLTAFSGYNYNYVKRITVADTAPSYSIDFDLTNTGTKNIVTDHYTHNFTLIDDKPVAGNYQVTFGFAPILPGGSNQTSSPGSWGSMSTISGKVISVTSTLSGSDYLWASFGGIPATVAANTAIVSETTGKAALKLECNWVPCKYNFWASPRSICPEPYISVKLNPGAEITWKDTYTLYPDGVQ
jgi:hypothetical protein